MAFYFTDGDSVTWDLSAFGSKKHDWWASKKRGTIPIAWTMQPMLLELHPYFLDYVRQSASKNDTLIVGPSGGGYTYIDQYPTAESRTLFAEWTGNLMKRTNMDIMNMISVNYDGPELQEIVTGDFPPKAIFMEEYFHPSLTGKIELHQSTLVTARRYALSKTFGINVDKLAKKLNMQSTDGSSENGYSLVGVEVWTHGISDIEKVINKLNSSRVQVVDINQYIKLIKKNVLDIY